MVAGARATHYSLRHRITAAISIGLFRNVTYTVRHGLLTGMRRKGGLGFLPAWFPGAGVETREMAFWRGLDLAGKVVWDVGAFEGLAAMYFARRAAKVIAWEANPRNVKRLGENIALNHLPNVVIRPVGVGREPGRLVLTGDPLMPGGTSGDTVIAAQTRQSVRGSRQMVVDVVTLDQDRAVHGLPLPNLIKVDIEGMELDALIGAADTIRTGMPALYIEMHGATPADKRAKAEALLRFLFSAGYTRIRHVETGATLDRAAPNVGFASQGHLYCDY